MVDYDHLGRSYTYIADFKLVGTRYYYKVGHRMKNGDYIWGSKYYFTSSPALGEETVQRVVIFGKRLVVELFLLLNCRRVVHSED